MSQNSESPFQLPLKKMRLSTNRGIYKSSKDKRPTDSLSQEELAACLGIAQTQVSRYEVAPETIPFDLGIKWCQVCGYSLESALALAQSTQPTGILPGTPYKELHRRLDLLGQYVAAAPKTPDSLPPLFMTPSSLTQKISQWKRKPNLLIAGRFDSGKSRLANALLGSEHLPSQYTPTTAVVTYIRHIEDRPEWQKEAVWLMDSKFDPLRWDDQKHCLKHSVLAGGYDTLREFGTKDNEDDTVQATAALVYIDSPLLHACTLIDVPGFQDDADDAALATRSASLIPPTFFKFLN